jgi:hypothetical protein
MIDRDTAYKAIYQATFDVLQTNLFGATQAPCADFYETLKMAAEKSFSSVLVVQNIEKE